MKFISGIAIYATLYTLSIGFYMTWTKPPVEEIDPNASVVSAARFALETTISNFDDIPVYR